MLFCDDTMISFCLRVLRSIFLCFLAALFCLATSPAEGQSASRRSTLERTNWQRSNPQFEALPLEVSPQNHLIVRAFINGKSALLGVDTGAPVSAIAVSRHRHYGLDSISATSKLPPKLMINGAWDAVGIAKSFRIGALNLVDEPMVTIDLGPESRSGRLGGEQEIDGILGADILFPTRAVLDCQRRLLILNLEPQSETLTPGVDYRGLRSVPIHVSEGYNLYVDGAINGAPARLMVDTGAFTTLLHRSFVRSMKIPLRDTPFTSAAVNLKLHDVQIARIRRLSVGSVDIVGHNVGVVDLGELIHGGLLAGKRPVAGLLGSELLQRHHGIIDFGTRRLYLKG
jgi:predicted aspartyl protease